MAGALFRWLMSSVVCFLIYLCERHLPLPACFPVWSERGSGCGLSSASASPAEKLLDRPETLLSLWLPCPALCRWDEESVPDTGTASAHCGYRGPSEGG